VTENRTDNAYEITWLIRRLFRAMASMADQYLAESDLTAADRAVLEFLFPTQECSVPEIARRYDVSRQHIQVTVNGLLKRGLLRSGANPRHKRSRLIRLSTLGRECFAEIRHNESAVIDEWFTDISDASLATTHQTLRSLFDKLK